MIQIIVMAALNACASCVLLAPGQQLVFFAIDGGSGRPEAFFFTDDPKLAWVNPDAVRYCLKNAGLEIDGVDLRDLLDGRTHAVPATVSVGKNIRRCEGGVS